MILFGAGDFSHAIGKPAQFDEPEVKAARRAVAEAARKHGKIAGALGGAATVRIGKVDLDGRINSVRPAVQNGVVTFVVALDNKSHASLRPSLRTDVYVITSYKDNILRVTNGPFYNGSVDQDVFVLEGDTAVRRRVNIGVSNFDYVELQGDEISAGDVVIVSDTKQHRHMDEIAVRSDK